MLAGGAGMYGLYHKKRHCNHYLPTWEASGSLKTHLPRLVSIACRISSHSQSKIRPHNTCQLSRYCCRWFYWQPLKTYFQCDLLTALNPKTCKTQILHLQTLIPKCPWATPTVALPQERGSTRIKGYTQIYDQV
jgi:hypothetical protein